MSRKDTIPVNLASLPRDNPMVWQEAEPATGAFLTSSDSLELLGMPSLQLPRTPRLPSDFRPAPKLLAWFDELVDALQRAERCGEMTSLTLEDLDQLSIQALDEILGQGEVCGETVLDGVRWFIQESVLTGVWRVRGDDGSDRVDVADIPEVVRSAANSLATAPIDIPQHAPNVMNGLAVLSEISDRAAGYAEQPGEQNHVLNFTLLPMSQGDQELLTGVLGRADLTLESSGFGDCRIMATTVRHVWAVQYVNAMDHTILDTIEIGDVPEAARAALVDFEDSRERLGEILQAYLS